MAQECQRVTLHANSLTLVWWIPEEYWEATFRAQDKVIPEQAAAVLHDLKSYTVIAMAHYKISGTSMIPDERAALLQNVEVKTGDVIAAPVDPSDLPDNVANFFGAMKPIMGRALGRMGEGLEFLAYQSAGGKPIIDPKNRGMLVISAFGQLSRFRTPLGSLLPSKTDSATGEEFPGNYQYNPFTGAKLPTLPAP